MNKYEFILNDGGYECTVIEYGNTMKEAIKELEETFEPNFIVSARIVEEEKLS